MGWFDEHMTRFKYVKPAHRRPSTLQVDHEVLYCNAYEGVAALGTREHHACGNQCQCAAVQQVSPEHQTLCQKPKRPKDC